MKKIILLLAICASYLIADFSRDNATQIVKDNDTCLLWSDHEIVNPPLNFQDAISYCENLTLGGHTDWRLPNHNELLTIMDVNETEPAISDTFTNTKKDAHWTSTTYLPNTAKAWTINFKLGDTHKRDTSSGLYVRCVRGPMP